MDVENLAKELILKNMTPEQQMAVLDSVRSSVAQAKEVQKRKIGENVDLVVQALKKIESDIRSRFDDVGNSIEKRVASIQDGRDGIDGKDGRDGKDGKNGRDGAKGDRGERGQDGRDGVDGVDGVSVSNARIDFDGSLIITLSSGVELNVGEVVAPDLAESIKVITNGGGTSQYVLDTLASLQTEIDNLIPSQTGNSGKFLTTNGTSTSWASVAGGLSYQGTWNANTNTPTLTSSVGVNGYYYIVDTAGSTNLNGITDWQIGDWLLFNGSVWQKIDQSNLVTSVAGRTGAVTLSNTDISGLGTMSTQNANSVAVTGGTINGTTIGATTATTGAFTTVTASTSLTTPTVQATNSGGLSLKNSAGTTQLSMGGGGGDNLSLLVSTNINGTNAQIDISPTGTGHVHIKPTGVNSIEIAPTYVGEIDNMTIGATTPKNGSFVDLSVTGTTSFDGSQGTVGQVLTSAGTGATPTWTTPTAGTVTSVTGTSPIASSGGATPAISLASGYGDTQNPYASKTANYFLAAPNGSSGAPTFRAIVAADIPTLNQNTTGSAETLTTGRTIAITGDLAYTSGSFNGSGNVTGTGTLATVNSNVGSFVASSITVNAKGLITAASTGANPSVTVYTSSSGTYTTPSGARWLHIRMVGGGGGGAGSGTSGTSGGTGGTTTFGTSTLTCNGGTGGTNNGGGGTGGSATITVGSGLSIAGGNGGGAPAGAANNYAGGMGGSSALGGNGSNGGGDNAGKPNAQPQAGRANTGGGGGGAAFSSSFAAGGGGAGGYIDAIITSPSATYSYAVGAGASGGTGAGGSNFANGAAGGSGVIYITAYF